MSEWISVKDRLPENEKDMKFRNGAARTGEGMTPQNERKLSVPAYHV